MYINEIYLINHITTGSKREAQVFTNIIIVRKYYSYNIAVLKRCYSYNFHVKVITQLSSFIMVFSFTTTLLSDNKPIPQTE